MVGYGEIIIYDEKSFKISRQLYIAMEMAKISLHDLVTFGGFLPESKGKLIARKILNRMKEMDLRNYIHRDIKPENILIDTNYDLKFGDLGFATENNGLIKRNCGTIEYLAPETDNSNLPYDGLKADIFAFGVTLFNIMSRIPLALRTEYREQIKLLLMNGDFKRLFEKHDFHPSKELGSLLKGMLAFNPSERFSLEDIKNSEWFRGELQNRETEIESLKKRVDSVCEEKMKIIETNVQKIKTGENTNFLLPKSKKIKKERKVNISIGKLYLSMSRF